MSLPIPATPPAVERALRASPHAERYELRRRLGRRPFDNLLRRRRAGGAGFGVAARIEDARGRMILVRLQPERAWTDRWMFPGGGAEPGESAREAILREIDEESGVTVVDLELWKALRNLWYDGRGRTLAFDFLQYTARYRRGELRTRMPEEIREVRWFSRIPRYTAFRSDWLRPPRRS